MNDVSVIKLITSLLSTVRGRTHYEEIRIEESVILERAPVSIRCENLPLCISVQNARLELVILPEVFSHDQTEVCPESFVIFNQRSLGEGIQGFVRLEKSGDRLTLGSHDELQAKLLNYPERLELRFLDIIHRGHELVFHPLAFDVDVTVKPVKRSVIDLFESMRRLSLEKLDELYTVPCKTYANDKALQLIKSVNNILETECCRPQDKRGQPGGLVEIPADRIPIIIGDLHAQVNNLLTLLSQNRFLQMLDDGSAVLLILGDAVHSEVPGELDKMDDSLMIMDLIFQLKIKYPEQVFYIRGNHDSFSDNVFKAGIAQCLMWERTIREKRGDVYLQEFNRFYEQLPYVAMSDDYVACHAAPIRTPFNKDRLINIFENQGLIRELTRNRLRRRDFPAGYHKADVYHFKKELGVSPDTQFLVSHSPLNRRDALWREAGRIKDHHIVFSANIPWVGIFSRINGHILPLSYHRERFCDALNHDATT